MTSPASRSATFLSGANADFIAELHARYLEDPGAVDPSWAAFFADLNDEAGAVAKAAHGVTWSQQGRAGNGVNGHHAENGANGTATLERGASPGVEQIRSATLDSVQALELIRAYRRSGHFRCKLDPLGLEKRDYIPELDPATYGFGPDDYDRPIFIGGQLGLETATLRQILDVLEPTYCSTVGVEYMHILDLDQRAWLQQRIEGIRNHTDFTVNGKRAILQRLTAAEGFERFLQLKYTGTKRFGIEGGEAMIPAIEQVMKRGGQLGVQEIVIGMAHRGRLNILANVMGKPFSAIFSEFQGNSASPEDVQGSGDVKYHLGTSSDRDFDGVTVHLSLNPNPSHLEVVNPVVLGRVRAKQMQLCDAACDRVLGILLHGDAAMAGQGIVAESLALSELPGYTTGGTIHFVVNNQIGFTTAPKFARSSPYPTDVAKMIQAPIFHVNGDDPEAVVHVSRVAAEFRQQFKQDVVIDVFCYRRQGHNEGDEPAFTQPVMYRTIKEHPTTREIYARQLVQEHVVTADEAEAMAREFHERMEAEFEASKSYKPNKADWLEGKWTGLESASGEDWRGNTGADLDTLRKVGAAITRVPDDFNVNSKIARQLKARSEMLESGEGIDWATAEALAFGSLVAEGTPVRFSGQDVGRGTFSQRHAVLYDQQDGRGFIPLKTVSANQAQFEIYDSPLSEAAVVGFEYGYSLTEPHALVLWEAQFGDFVNMAQMIIDQFICSGEAKWLRMSGVTLLLPHGYEGQGPEHSSGRLERFLQLCAEDNMQVANCTTPANYFHILRRQVRRTFRKPLIVMTPKSLLRHKAVVSKLDEFTNGTSFHRVLPETEALQPDTVRRVVLCTGKLYYDLLAERQNHGVTDVALIRVEQLYPFPAKSLATELAKYPKAEVVWCQEEPENMGAWFFVDRRIERVLSELEIAAKRPRYVGRPASAATATGLLRRHNREQAQLIDEAVCAK